MKPLTKKPGPVRAALLRWMGVPVDLLSDDFWRAWSASLSSAGQQVNETTIMSLSAAWACTRLISEAISTLPLRLYERTPSGRRLAVEHPLYQILHSSPNADSTASLFWESTSAAMLLRGNGFSEIHQRSGRIVALDFLAPHRLSPVTDTAGQVVAMNYTTAGRQRRIPMSSIFHIPAFSLDGRWGLSSIRYGASVFGSALASNAAANSTFEKGLSPTVAFTIERVLKKEQRADFREGLEAVKGALNAGNSPLLEGGMDAKVIGIPPRDAQLLESRAFSVEEVCRWFGVDPSMVGHGGKVSNWGTGLEQKMIAFLTFTLRPWLSRIEQTINKRLLNPVEQQRFYAEFSIEGLLRADSAARAAFYAVMVNNGIMTRDEVRVMENLPMKGGNADALTVQSAMVPLDDIGATQADGERVRNALADWLSADEQRGRNDE